MQAEERSAAVPQDASKFGWQRRYTWLVSKMISESGRDGAKPMLPSAAGEKARASVVAEFQQRFPGQPLPAFPPFQP